MKKTPFNKNGMLIIDKPVGLSSAQVVSRVKRITGAKKVGHTGTLDPFATGLMICGINAGTRLSRFFLSCDKTYIAGLRLGVETDTMDCTGEVISKSECIISDVCNKSSFEEMLKDFEGRQEQLPPVYSALKHNGVPLYKLARKGTPVQKPPREITIYRNELLEIDLPDVTFEVECSSGTYIRTLASDIGRKIGCGGHLVGLRRVTSGSFNIKDAITLDELEKLDNPSDVLVSMNDALPELPYHVADNSLEAKIANGVGLGAGDGVDTSGIADDDGFIKILNGKKQLIAVVEYNKISDSYNYCCVFHF